MATQNENLIQSLTRLFESQGFSHEQAEEQARLSAVSDGGASLADRLKAIGFTEAQAKAFMEGRPGDPDLTEAKPGMSTSFQKSSREFKRIAKLAEQSLRNIEIKEETFKKLGGSK